jgi:hypothetical protein
LPFRDVTIVNIDGRAGESSGAQLALTHSARELPGAAVLLLSPDRPAGLRDGIRHVPIQRLGYFDYSLFVIYALHRFVSTDFALIVQDDGWVLDGRQWRDEYRNYDYIGAPTNFARITDSAGARHIRGYDWMQLLNDPRHKIDFVMNGGFSLRSRRLLSAPTRLGLDFVLPPVAGLQGPPYEMQWSGESQLEDVHLCLDMRAALESAGIRFAPFRVARQFAFEHLHPGMHGDLNLMEVFGHHSKLRKLKSLEPLTVFYQERRQFLSRVYGEHLIAEVYSKRGYRIELPPD